MSITIENLSFRYANRQEDVLRRVTLRVRPGELVAVVGPSGSGKSTLLRLIAGLMPRHGYHDSLLGGLTLGSKRPPDQPPGAVALMFQEPALLPHRTVERNIALALEMLNWPQPQIDDAVRESLIEVGLNHHRHLLPHELSVGMKSRVSLAMTVATRPSFLLLDEPFGALDLAWRLSLYGTLERLRSRDRPTAVLVTHDLREAIFLADVVVVLGADGCIRPPVSITLAKPESQSAAELASYNNRSIGLYTVLERLLLDASPVTPIDG